jgi:hypothetical protein
MERGLEALENPPRLPVSLGRKANKSPAWNKAAPVDSRSRRTSSSILYVRNP